MAYILINTHIQFRYILIFFAVLVCLQNSESSVNCLTQRKISQLFKKSTVQIVIIIII